MVIALVDHRGLLPDLRKVEAVEVQPAPHGRVRDVNVRELSPAKLVHLAAVIFFPRAVAQGKFVRQRHDHHFA